MNKYDNLNNNSQERRVVLQFISFIMLTFLVVQQSISFILHWRNSQVQRVDNKKTENLKEFKNH